MLNIYFVFIRLMKPNLDNFLSSHRDDIKTSLMSNKSYDPDFYDIFSCH